MARLIERARLLGDNPHEGRETDEPNARVVVVPRLRYFIFYEIEGDEEMMGFATAHPSYALL